MNNGPLNLQKHFQKMATTGSDYLVGNNLEVLYELLEGGFLEDHIEFRHKIDSVIDEGEIGKKRMLKCEICGKEYVSSRGLKRHQGMKYKNYKTLPEKASKLTASEFSSLVKRFCSICQQYLCSSEDIRSKFSSFDFRSSHRRCSVKKGVLRNFAKFAEKHLCQSLFFNKGGLQLY